PPPPRRPPPGRSARAGPSPRLEAQTMALRPAMPRSMGRLLNAPAAEHGGMLGWAGQFLWPRRDALSTGVGERRLGLVVDAHGGAAPDEVGADEAVEPQPGQQQVAQHRDERRERRHMPARRP